LANSLPKSGSSGVGEYLAFLTERQEKVDFVIHVEHFRDYLHLGKKSHLDPDQELREHPAQFRAMGWIL
jgi:hypothetical protein